MRGFVIQTKRDGAGFSRHYLLAVDEHEALARAASFLSVSQDRLSVLREMAQWEIDIFVPFPNEIYAAP